MWIQIYFFNKHRVIFLGKIYIPFSNYISFYCQCASQTTNCVNVSSKLPKNVNLPRKANKKDKNNPKKVTIRQIYSSKFEKKMIFFFED
jgi:hypothetical protein